MRWLFQTFEWRPVGLAIFLLASVPCIQALPVQAQSSERAQESQEDASATRRSLGAPPRPEEREYQPGVRVQPIKEEALGRKILLFPFRVLEFPFRILGQGLEKSLQWVEQNKVLVRLQNWILELVKKGYFPVFGGFPDGAGFAVSLGILKPVGPVSVYLQAGVSVQAYAEAKILVFPGRPPGRARDSQPPRFVPLVEFRYSRRNAERFYGVGPNSLEDDEGVFGRQIFSGEAQLRWRLSPRTNVSFSTGYERHLRLRENRTDDPDLDDVFAALPGQNQNSLQWITGSFSVEHEHRDFPGNPTQGYFLASQQGVRASLQGDSFSHFFSDSTAEFHLPIGWKRSLGLITQIQSAIPFGGSEVPFFHLPFLGGTDSLKAYDRFRFADRLAGLATARYTFTAAPDHWLGVYGFGQVGSVAPTLGSLLDDLKPSVGVGFQFQSETSRALRLEFAFGEEGSQVWVKVGS